MKYRLVTQTIEEQAEKLLIYQAKLKELVSKKVSHIQARDEYNDGWKRPKLQTQESDSQLKSQPSDSNLSHRSGRKSHLLIAVPTNKNYNTQNSSSDHSHKSRKAKRPNGK